MGAIVIDVEADNWLRELLPQIVDLARQAGDAIMAAYGDVNPEVEYKPDNSPLTRADLASHQVILDGLARLSPHWPVLSEESAEIPFEQRKPWRYFWMVDPLDGTREFLHRNGEFTVNIALVEAGAPILGVVFAPAIDHLYFAARSAGAYRVTREVTTPINAARPASAPRRTVVSRSHRSRGENLERLAPGAGDCEFIAMGSSLKFCLVAEGAANLYPRIGPTMEWDTAAAHCILEQSGGSVADLNGNPLAYNKPVLLNPGFLARGVVEDLLPEGAGAALAPTSLAPRRPESNVRIAKGRSS
jgi:3'(2'), 5'-bisphosphate nucleotidase